jgi:hypothetical protein
MHQVESSRRRWTCGQVVAQHVKRRIGGCFQQRGVDVGCQHMPGGSDLLSQPCRHALAACTSLPTTPAIADAERLDAMERALVEQCGERVEVIARQLLSFGRVRRRQLESRSGHVSSQI